VGWLGPDQSVRLGRYLIARAQPGDAAAYALADAQMVSATYAYMMPPEFEQQRLGEVNDVADQLRQQFAADLDRERSGAEPARRTWIAWDNSEVAGIAVSAGETPQWERELGVAPVDGITHQLNHLYLRPAHHGAGLGQALLDLALPGRMRAYLWLVGGNSRAERFYARNGFETDPVTYSCGPLWFNKPLYRMYRR